TLSGQAGCRGGEIGGPAPRLERNEKKRRFPILEPRNHRVALRRGPVEVFVSDALGVQVGAAERENLDELRKDERAAALRHELAHEIEERFALHAARRREPRIDE